MKENKDKIIEQKEKQIKENKTELQKRKEKENLLQSENNDLLENMAGQNKVVDKKDKLKDVLFKLKDKHSRESKMITFYEENDECPTC